MRGKQDGQNDLPRDRVEETTGSAGQEPGKLDDSAAKGLSRRCFLLGSSLAAVTSSLALYSSEYSDSPATQSSGDGAATQAGSAKAAAASHTLPGRTSAAGGGMGTIRDISQDELSHFDPTAYLTSWNFNEKPAAERSRFYRESRLSNGQRLREYFFIARDRRIEIAPGLYFPAWTYNDQVPGPTIRATKGDRIRIWFVNEGSHPHTIHFHGWHPFEMDGTYEHQFVKPAGQGATGSLDRPFGPGADPQPWWEQGAKHMRQHGLDIYEFDAEPVGLHLYHCHSVPLKRHIHKGLYGTFIVDPPGDGPVAARRPKIDPDTNEVLPDDHPVREFVMLMNGFDTNFDGDNEVYAANTFAFHYMRHPIRVNTGDLVRVYLNNLTEFDPINSFHLHAGFFRVYRTGTRLRSEEYTDTVMMCQAERAILEFRLRWPGKYMFHAHQSEFAELGWMGVFEAVDRGRT